MIEVGSIEHVFEISGRGGLTIAPGIKKDGLPRSLKVGDEIIIVNPDGSKIETTIHGVEMLKTREPIAHNPFSLPQGVAKGDVKPGAKIYVRA
jgi:translation elongation factor EF-Tu-like GTPase